MAGLEWDEGPGIGGPHAPYFQRSDSSATRRPRTSCSPAGAPTSATARRNCSRKSARRQKARAWPGNTIAPASRLSAEEQQRLEASGVQPAIRFKVPDGKTSYIDHVRGRIEVDHQEIEDFVILRSNGLPIYHLSVVADDIDMGITHVIRGDDHISNTPKHILLFQALGRTPPEFAHVPLILGTDKKKLSKRHGITSVTEYERIGYLPDAMVNFLALLGWSPGAIAR